MIHVFILSNTVSELEQISKNLRRCIDDSLCLVTTTDSHEALSFIQHHQIIFDLFIISVRLEKQSGYMVEKKIRKNRFYQFTPILFITPDSNMLDFGPLSTFAAYRHHNYLAFPLDDLNIQGKFCLYLDSIYTNQIQTDKQNKKIHLKSSTGSRYIPIKSILYIEIQNKMCTIYSLQGKFLLRRTSLSAILAMVDSPHLVRCHRYFAVNLQNIDYIEKNSSRLSTIHFKTSSLTCPMSNTYSKNIVKEFPYLEI